jgi:dipeptidyl aminopeptidase/acylaminoacyl peptidase
VSPVPTADPGGPPATGRPSPNGARAAERLRAWLELPLSTSPAVAADSETVLYLSSEGGHDEPWSVPRMGGPPRRRAATPDRIGAVVPSPLRPEALLLRDRGGDEHWQIDLLPLDGGAAEPRTSAPTVIHPSALWAPDGESFLFTSNARDRRFFDVYRQRRDGTAPPERLLEEDGYLALLELRDERILVAHHRTNLDTDLLLGTGSGWQRLNPHDGEQRVTSATLGADAVYAAADPHRELTALLRLRPGRPTPEFLREYPGDVEIVRASPDGRALLLVVNRDGWSESFLYDPASGEERPLRSGPRGVIRSVAWCPDGAGYAFALSHAEGQDIFYRNVETGKERRLTRARLPLPGRPVEPRLGRCRASDGLSVPYWEYVPGAGTPRRTLVLVHGGPEAQARPEFSPIVQFLVAEGWRVVAPNVRGSSGYGRSYLHLDDGRLRTDAVRDLREVVEALRREGKAPVGRVAVAGGSYGGFMVLAALTTYPELFAAGVEVVGIANFLTFLERTAPWRRRRREAEYGSLATDREFLREISPRFHVERIRAPLLVVHGRNDPRVPFGEAVQIVDALRALGRPVELLELPEAGHGLRRRADQLEGWGRAVEFLERYLPADG